MLNGRVFQNHFGKFLGWGIEEKNRCLWKNMYNIYLMCLKQSRRLNGARLFLFFVLKLNFIFEVDFFYIFVW